MEGPVSSGVMEGKYCIEIRLFLTRVRKIKYLNKSEESKTDAANYLQNSILKYILTYFTAFRNK